MKNLVIAVNGLMLSGLVVFTYPFIFQEKQIQNSEDKKGTETLIQTEEKKNKPIGTSTLKSTNKTYPTTVDMLRRLAHNKEHGVDAQETHRDFEMDIHSPLEPKLHENWLKQKEDPDWTKEIEAYLKDSIERSKIKNISTDEVSCRETLCRATMSFVSVDDALLLKKLSDLPDTDIRSYGKLKNGRLEAVVYAARQHQNIEQFATTYTP